MISSYIYCYKTFEDINLSWTKPTSFCPKLKDASEIERKIFYTDSWNAAMQFGENLQYFKKIFYNNFLKNPNSIINDLINWINLIAYDFDYSEVSSSKNIKNIISNTTAFPLATQIINKDIEVKISDCKKISFPEIKCENNLMI